MASNAAEDPASAAQVLEELCQSTKSMDKEHLRTIDKYAEACKAVLLESAHEFVKGCGGSPMLTSKSADGTPLKVTYQQQSVMPSGTRFTRSGKAGHEFLLKNQFIRGDVNGDCASRCILQDPCPLHHGKGAGAIFAACAQHWRSLRQLGHPGIAIEHYCYDRCGLEAQERYWRSWHDAAPIPQCLANHDVAEGTFRKTELVIVTPCAAHDAQTAFRWGMGTAFQDKQRLRYLYIGIDSLRNSMDFINRHLAEWIARRLDFVPHRSFEDVEHRRVLWQSLDIEAETVDVLSDTLQYYFEDGRIHVTEQMVGNAEVLDLIMQCLQSAWKFVRFADSRFLTAGSSCRTLLAAYLLGIDDLVELILEAPGKAPFYLHGFKRLGSEENGNLKMVVAECAFVSRVTDGVLAEIIEDPRVALRHDELWEVLAGDMKWLLEVPDMVWTSIANVANTTGTDIRAHCIRGGHASFHFFWRRVLEPAGRLPWTLVRGDLQGNLNDLAAGACPEDPVSAKLWKLCQDEYPPHQLVATLRLLADISWSTLAVEQQHGTMASLHRHHPDYQLNTLVGRTLLMHVRKLLPHVSEDEKQLARVRLQLQKTLARQPHQTGARHALVSQLFSHLRSRGGVHSTRDVPVDMARRIMAQSSRLLAARTVSQHRELDRASVLRADDKRTILADEAQRLREQRDLLLQRLEADDQVRKPLIMSQCHLAQSDLTKLKDMVAPDGGFGWKRVLVLREESKTVPIACG